MFINRFMSQLADADADAQSSNGMFHFPGVLHCSVLRFCMHSYNALLSLRLSRGAEYCDQPICLLLTIAWH